MTIPMMVFGLLTLLSSAGVVFARRSLHSALCLVVTLFLVAVHFALLGADFLASLQVMVYAGAIMVLVVFVVMLLGLDKEVDAAGFRLPGYFAAVFAALFGVILVYAVSNQPIMSLVPADPAAVLLSVDAGSPQEVGKLLYTKYVYAFEVTGVLLLAAIIGATVLAYDKKRPLAEGRGLRAMHAKETGHV